MAAAFTGLSVTHTERRTDAIIDHGRERVPTGPDTQWVSTLDGYARIGGRMIVINEDQTEIWLRLPPGYKFGIKILDDIEGSAE